MLCRYCDCRLLFLLLLLGRFAGGTGPWQLPTADGKAEGLLAVGQGELQLQRARGQRDQHGRRRRAPLPPRALSPRRHPCGPGEGRKGDGRSGDVVFISPWQKGGLQSAWGWLAVLGCRRVSRREGAIPSSAAQEFPSAAQEFPSAAQKFP